MQTFIVIDGNAMMHRAFHGLPPLTSPTGQVVNAVYGFFSMFLKILQDYKPTHVIVCFDRPKPTFRQELYVGYHQHRPSMSGDLSSQFPIVHEILEKMHVQIFEVDGYEADDLIGTLAMQAVQKTEDGEQKTDSRSTDKTEKARSVHSVSSAIRSPSSVICPLEVIIVSADRDLLQLVNPYVKVLAPVVGITKMLLNDEAKVEERFGIKPSQIIDYKALVGDASDGYPGVTGIGPKTAASLLQKYETFENLYQHIGELPAKVMEKLATDAEQAALAKRLATIVTDAPIKLVCDDCLMTNIDVTAAQGEFEALGMRSLVNRLPSISKPVKRVKKKEESGDQMSLL